MDNWQPVSARYTKLLAALGSKVERGQVAGGEMPANVYPRTYDEIAPGHLVIVQESLKDGWYEGIVLERNGDMVTVRYRDYPKLPKFMRHLDAVALIRPPAAPSQPGTESKAAEQ